MVKTKKILCSLLVVLMVLMSMPVGEGVFKLPQLGFEVKASALNSSGQCGDNVYWTFDSGTGEVVISGTGEMWDYELLSDNLFSTSPFFREDIKSAVIKDGVTSISDYLFAYTGSLTSVSIPNSVMRIGDGAFCVTGLKKVAIPYGVKSIGENAFQICRNLSELTIPNSVTSIGDWAFCDCEKLAKIELPDSVKNLGFYAFVRTAYAKDDNNWEGDALYIGKHLTVTQLEITSCDIKDGTINIANGAFYGRDALTKVTIPNSITAIPKEAFKGCTSLKEIAIPNTVTSISESAFENCTALAKINIPNRITSINKNTFKNCTSLANVTIPNSVKTIEESAFMESGLTSINIPYGVESIGERAFEKCSSLANITIADSVTSVGRWAFSHTEYYNNDDNWEYYDYPDSEDYHKYCTLYIGKYLIDSGSNCGRTSISYRGIKEGTICICDYALTYSTGDSAYEEVEDLVIPNGVRNIGVAAFLYSDRYSKPIGRIKIPASVETIGTCALSDCQAIIVDENNPNYSSDSDGVLFNKDKTELIQYPAQSERTEYTIPESVTKIDDQAFSMSNITNVVIPSSVKTIGIGAFSECLLTSVDIPNSVEEMGIATFHDCRYLENVNIGSGISVIPSDVFSFCGRLKSVELHEGLQVICEDAFHYTGWLLESINEACNIKIPDSVIRIDKNAFYEAGIIGLTLGKGLKRIGRSAFERTGIKTLIIPDNVTSIDLRAFADCPLLENVTIGKGLTCLSNNLFCNCTSIKEISIPSNITTICGGAFEGCSKLSKVELNDGLRTMETSVFYGTALKSIKIPGTVTSISFSTFSGCKTLEAISFGEGITEIQQMGIISTITNVTLPETLEKIGYLALYSCSFKSIRIPHNITRIGLAAFSDCNELTDVYYDGTEDEWYKIDILQDNDSLLDATIHFKDGTTHTHSFTSSVTKEPTHEEEGVTTYTCKCGKIYTEAIAKLQGHTYTSKITRYPTHTKVGIMTYTCACGDTYTQEIPKTAGHYYSYKYVEPTCTSNGYTLYTCECGDSYTANVVPTTGHTDNDSNGYCDNCGAELAKNCSCNCHKGGISSFFFKIALLFQRIFGKNKYCSCGVKHY